MHLHRWIPLAALTLGGAALAAGGSINIKIETTGLKTKKQTEEKEQEKEAAAPAVVEPVVLQPLRPDPLPEDWSGGGATAAAAMGGALVVEGSFDDALSVTVPAKAGNCYSLFIDADTAQKPAEDFQWSTSRSFQEFSISKNVRAYEIRGFCALSDGSVTGKMRVEIPGTAKLRYAVVSWPKSGFPDHQAAGMAIRVDHCDLTAWRAHWLDPIPGSITYSRNEPMLVRYLSGDTVNYWDASGQSKTVRITPDAKRIENSLSGAPVWALETDELVRCQCTVLLDHRYDNALDKASRDKKYAQTESERAEAANRYNQTLAKYNAEMVKTGCITRVNDASKNFDKLLDQIVDAYNAGPPPSPIDRPPLLGALVQ